MLKNTDIIFEGNSYTCELKPDTKDSIICSINLNGIPSFEGKITLKEIYSQITALDEYTMEEIYNILKDVEKEKFELMKSSNQYNLKIMIQVLKKVKELNIHLEQKSQSNMEILQHILSLVKSNDDKIDFLEKELKDLGVQKKIYEEKKKEEENREKPIFFPDIEISKMEFQRKNSLLGEGKWPGKMRALQSGRIAIEIYETGIAIIDSESLEISYVIKIPCKDYIELQKDCLAIIKEGKEYGEDRIFIIKLGEKNYTELQKSNTSSYTKLGKLWNGKLIVMGNNDIYFYKENNNLNEKELSIPTDDKFQTFRFVFQTQKNEIVYGLSKKIVFYDFANNETKNSINCNSIGLEHDTISSSTLYDMISDELLCLVAKSKETYQYCAFLINVYKREKVNEIKLEEPFKLNVLAICAMKGKYLITCVKNNFRQYKVEKDNIRLISEVQTSSTDIALVFFNNEKNGKFISHDNYNVYEFY